MSDMQTPKDVKEFIARKFRYIKDRIDVFETGDYYFIESISSIRSGLRGTVIHRTPLFIIDLLKHKHTIPLKSRRLREAMLIHKYYGSIDAVCILYSRRNRLRLNCAGRPNAIEIVIDYYKPHSLMTLYPPFQIRQCMDKEIIEYTVSMKRNIYLCKLIGYPSI